MEAQLLFEQIEAGYKVQRPEDAAIDRMLRKMIENAQKNSVPIINNGDGEGYFLADLEDPEQRAMARAYQRKKQARRKAEMAAWYGVEVALAPYGNE